MTTQSSSTAQAPGDDLLAADDTTVGFASVEPLAQPGSARLVEAVGAHRVAVSSRSWCRPKHLRASPVFV